MTRRWPDISKPRGDTGVGAGVRAGLGILAGIIVLIIVGLVIAAILGAARPAHATWKPEYGQSPPSVQLWFRNAQTTIRSRARIRYSMCCEQAERLMTKFVSSAVGEWSYYPDPTCTSKGCKLLPIPNDVVHDDQIKAQSPDDDKLAEFDAMRREGVLFIYQGQPTSFWPPEPGG